MNASPHPFVVIGLVVGLRFYLLLAIVALSRRVVNRGRVVAVNLLLGWSLVGRAVAFAPARTATSRW